MSRVAASTLARWRDDPVAFVREVFDIEPDPWQVNFLHAYNQNPRVAAKACKGPGKTAVLAWCAWHFLATRPFPKIAATSISGDNLRDGLWSEMAKWQHKSNFLKSAFTWTKMRIYANDNPETHWMAARTWSKSADADSQADTLAGLHADYILFIIDEAGGVPDALMAAAEAALATGIECKLLICGNPTHLTGPLYRACTKEKRLWKLIEITGDPDDPNRSPRISKKWALEQIEKYGRDNPWVLVNVFGKFPPASLNALLGPDDVSAAMRRQVPLDAYQFAPKILGIDVARQGDDESVAAPRQGMVHFKAKKFRIPDTQQLAGAMANIIRKWEPDAVFVDATGGWGWGLIDALNGWGFSVTPVEFSSKASDRQYYNKRAEMCFEFAHHIKNGACLAPSDGLVEEATAQEYFFRKDQFQMIEKEQIKQRIGRSPDEWDARMLTYAYPVARKNPLTQMTDAVSGKDYDPLADYKARMTHTKEDVADYDPLG